ncbi:MAG: TIM-barrel domain-containing protein [Myxococcota bacterium]|nr:TIM-barrel domain-containing protein [Myxococcota bacterium]
MVKIMVCRRWIVAGLFLFLIGCTDGPTVTPAEPDQEISDNVDSGVVEDMTQIDPDSGQSDLDVDVLKSGELRIQLSQGQQSLAVYHGETLRFRMPIAGFQLGTLDEIAAETNYDPYYILDGNEASNPPGLVWLVPSAGRLTADNDMATLELTYDQLGTGQLIFRVSAENRLTARFVAPDGPVGYMRVNLDVDETEAFYGMGEVFDDVNNRGKLRPMQIELDTELESSFNEAHIPIPLLYGHRGWGLFVESLRPGIFDVAKTQETVIDAIFGTGVATAEGLQFHIFTGERTLDLTRHYYELTGFPKLPAEWAYGPWIWRDENEDEAQVRSDIQTIRDLDLATSGYWIDRPYASAVNSFDWDPRKFDEPQGMIDFIHDMGFRFALWHTPYVGAEGVGNELTETTQEFRDIAEREGYYPPQIGLATSKWGSPIDLTNPDAFAWWQSLIRRYSDMGVEGYKLDYAEDIVPGIFLARGNWEFADGSNDQTMHARYQTLYHQVYAETLPETGGFLLVRSATWGGQTNGVIVWPGDLDANFAAHRERVVDGDEEYGAVGGLIASIIAGLSLGPSGYPFYGSDTGGYRRSPPNKEVFTRWFQQTALSSVMQVGTNTNNVAWEFDEETGFDEEMLDWYRIYTRLHLRLFPYAWTYARQIEQTGRPIQRAYGLQYPDAGLHPSDIYFFGDDLLVAPVVVADARTKQVPFPDGQWLDWWTGEIIEGGQELMVDAPLSKLPLYLRAGGIIPLLRETIDTLSPTTVEGIESFANDPGRLHTRIAAGPAHSFTLYDGTIISHRTDENDLVLASTAGDTYPESRRYDVMNLAAVPTEVQYGAASLTRVDSSMDLAASDAAWFLDPDTNMVHIKVVGTEDVRLVGAR